MIRISAAVVLGVSLALAATLPAQATPNHSGVCAPLDSGKTDVAGNHQTVIVDAPEGFLISGYCVKAGSTKQGLGPESFTLSDPVSSLTIAHSSGKDISHYSLSYVPVVEEPPYVPPVVECGEWEVPGILDEHGNPTGCVSNHPCPGLEAPECAPVVVPEEPAEPVIPVEPVTPVETVDLPTIPVSAELARTGSTPPIIPIGIASLLLAVGAFLIRRKARA
tara:strand:- start:530 stop:1192 length:663 start_codon:yes stop_codon:yes gene_type:complete